MQVRCKAKMQMARRILKIILFTFGVEIGKNLRVLRLSWFHLPVGDL